VPLSCKTRGLPVNAHPSAGTGRRGDGDWMETDQWTAEAHDLLILERTQEVAGRFQRVLVSRKIRGLRVGADPPGGTGRHGHGDWMVTDRWTERITDLLIPRRVMRTSSARPQHEEMLRIMANPIAR
jgi:hypothetical protein